MKPKIIYFSILMLAAIALSQCKKTTETDKALFARANTTTGFTYYKNADTIRIEQYCIYCSCVFIITFGKQGRFIALLDGE